jgi:hypothetical protein
MPLFRKRPEVVEAFQYHDGEQRGEVAQDVIDGNVRYPEDGTMLVRTPEGERIARSTDWIVRDENGALLVRRPDIFAKTYEPVR